MLSQQNCGIKSIPPSSFPSLDEAAMNYEQYQGVLTRFSVFGNDPLSAREDLIKRRELLSAESNPDFNQLFTNVVSSDGELFFKALMNYKQLTYRLVDLM